MSEPVTTITPEAPAITPESAGFPQAEVLPRERESRGAVRSEIALPNVSRWLFRQFCSYTRWYLQRNFRQVLLLKDAHEPIPDDQPLICLMNHPCWWDPLIGLMVATQSFPQRQPYGAMDDHALESYAIFKKLGFFGVERNSARGGVQFLRLAQRIVEQPGAALWLTPQGRYADVRERPVTLLAGVSHLLSRMESGFVMPVSLEYFFWDERLPFASAALGTPVSVAEAGVRSAAAWNEVLSDAMATTQDRLSAAVMRRDPAAFEVMIDGRRGMGNLYGWWRDMIHRA